MCCHPSWAGQLSAPPMKSTNSGVNHVPPCMSTHTKGEWTAYRPAHSSMVALYLSSMECSKGWNNMLFPTITSVHNRPLEQARCLLTLAATPSVQLGAECSTSCACAYPLNLISTEWKFSTHHHLPNWSVAMLSFTSWLMHVVANAWTYSPRLIFLHRFIYCLVGVNDTKKL